MVGVQALLGGCPKLKSLTLINAKRVELAAFEHMLGKNLGDTLCYLRLGGIPSLFGSEAVGRVREGLEADCRL